MADREIINKYVAARVANDKDGFLATLADDAELTTPKGTWKGHAEITKFLTEQPFVKGEGPEFTGDFEEVESGHFQRKGTIKKMMMNWNLVHDIWVANGKITKSVLKQA